MSRAATTSKASPRRSPSPAAGSSTWDRRQRPRKVADELREKAEEENTEKKEEGEENDGLSESYMVCIERST